jgi:hypothetical protein
MLIEVAPTEAIKGRNLFYRATRRHVKNQGRLVVS